MGDVRFEIVRGIGRDIGFFLYVYDGPKAWDTWHRDVDEAMRQAEHQCGVPRNAWRKP